MSLQQIDLDQLKQSGATDGQAPIWNNDAGKWIPGAAGGSPSPSLVTLNRTNGTLNSVTETIGADTRITTMVRDSSGVLLQTVEVFKGKTITSTFNRTDGYLTGVTIVET